MENEQLEYCHLDTLAMVRILEKMREMAGWKKDTCPSLTPEISTGMMTTVE